MAAQRHPLPKDGAGVAGQNGCASRRAVVAVRQYLCRFSVRPGTRPRSSVLVRALAHLLHVLRRTVGLPEWAGVDGIALSVSQASIARVGCSNCGVESDSIWYKRPVSSKGLTPALHGGLRSEERRV